ncbi:MAG: tfdA 3, partial [Candidatus Eremiobacteraeota bacterium]|nr:tfdA 3 [Candidatus Eremiobacteraeota bacterium]
MEMIARPLHPSLGAEVTGVDLHAITEETAAEIVRLLDRFAVLVFPDQSLFDEAQVRLAGLLGGTLHYGQGAKVVEARPRFDDPALSNISNLDDDGSLLSRADPKRMYAL